MTVHFTSLAQDIPLFLHRLATPAMAARDSTGQLRCALSRLPDLLACAFNTVAPPDRHRRPALELEASDNLTGIGQAYAFPAGVSADILESYVMALHWSMRHNVTPPLATLGALHKVVDTLVALNPALETIRYHRHDFMQAYHLAMGVTSGFNPKDIAFFVSGKTLATEDDSYRSQRALAESMVSNRRLSWAPAPETMARIIRQKQPAP